ncbi:MAG: bifunctional enoyl-CoA hydratase/phosphate acetyltransferase [Anaerolineae bacterium]
MDCIENKTFDEIEIGDSASLRRVLTTKDIQLFAVMSGDVNPAHLDEEYAKSEMFHKIIAHGMWGGSLVSTVLGTQLPGPGTIYLNQTFSFRRPVAVGDEITVTVTAVKKDEEKKWVTFDCQCVNQSGKAVIAGEALVMAPTSKVKRPRASLPEVRLHDPGAQYRRLIAHTEGLEPIKVAVVHPVEANALHGAVDAARAGLIVPVLVGPEYKIRRVAEAEGIDLAPYRLVATDHSHAAAQRAVVMARGGEVEALMKGSLPTEELMLEVVAGYTGLSTGRRISHVAVVDVPGYPRPVFITDAAINIYPTLEHKRDIVQNAINLARILGIDRPKVAILAAVETVSARLDSTVDAAALCKMADRGQISGGIVDGPLAFDDAISPEAAAVKGINPRVAGQADILVAPDLEAGTLLTKQLEYLAGAQAADVVVGARVPIVLTSRADTPLARQASCAVALLVAQHNIAAQYGRKIVAAQENRQ